MRLRRNFLPRYFSIVAFMFAVGIWPALASDSGGEQVNAVVLSEIENAKGLIGAGRLDEAKAALDALAANQPDDPEVSFLLGIVAMMEKDYEAAIGHFRSILVDKPDAERVRLELARAYYLKGDYDASAREFRFARAGDVPPTVAENIDHYLAAMRESKDWSYDLSFAIAPDSNINAAPSIRQIDLFGLPFLLSDDARRASGLGLALDAGGEWSPAIADGLKLRAGVQTHRLEYSNDSFDDMTISAYAGPRFSFGRINVSALMTGFRRWFASELYEEGRGGRLEFNWYPTARWQLTTSAEAQSVTYPGRSSMNGPVSSLNASISYSLTPSSAMRALGGFVHQEAESAVYANNARQLAVGYYQEFPAGFSAYVEPGYFWSDFQAPYGIFGVTRRDRTFTSRLDVMNRRIDVFGFSPRLSYIYTRQRSTIELFDYDRNRFEIAVAKSF